MDILGVLRELPYTVCVWMNKNPLSQRRNELS